MKKRILIMSDSPRIKTGFANVGRHVAEVLHNSGRWDVHYLAWFDNDSNKEYAQLPYKLYNTARDKDGNLIREDQYAYHTFKHTCDQIDPDLVWICSDLWMSCAYQFHYTDKETRPHTVVLYSPIDSDPVAYETKHGGGPTGQFILNWPEHFRRFDEVIAYGKYGMDQINKRCGSEVVTKYIHHGADTDIYKPVDDKIRNAFRRDVLGVDDEDYLILTVARNQPRKSYPEMLAAVRHFIDHYETQGRKVRYYCHAPIEDVGWNLKQLVLQNGLSYRELGDRSDGYRQHRVILDSRLLVGSGPSDQELNMLYNAADLGLFIYTSEGWALPPHECMAAGTPTIMTDYSAPSDWAKGRTLFVKPTLLIPEPITNLRKAYHNPEDISHAINRMYKNVGGIVPRLEEAGLAFAHENSWSLIQQQWLDYLDSLPLKENRNKKATREIVRLSDADTLEPTTSMPSTTTEATTAPLVSIIIPTNNGGQMLHACINSIYRNGWSNFEIILVDNGTWEPMSKNALKDYERNGAKIVEWRRKYVPSMALNLAAKEATGEYLMFLDNDTQLSPGAISGLVECYSTSNNVGVVGPKMSHPQNPQVFATGYHYDNRLGFTPANDGEGIHPKEAISGTCLMVPKKLFDLVDGFDESYKFLWQDVDLCMKLKAINKFTLCNTNAHVSHLGGVTRRYISKAIHTIDYMTLSKKWWPNYNTRKDADQHRVAIVKLISMGDCIACTPILKKLRVKYPESYITLYTTVMYEDIFKDNPHIDEIKTVGPIDWSLFGPACSLMAYDAVTYNILSSEAWDICIELETLSHWMEYRRDGVSLSRHYARMCNIELDDDMYDVYLSEDNYKVAEKFDNAFPGNGPLVILHTTAGWALKEWTKEGFKEIAKRLYDAYGARIYVLGKDPEERLDSTYVRNVGGQLSLRDIVALMKRAKLFIGADSGDLHLAKAANECAILGLFSSTAVPVVGFNGVKKFIALQSAHTGIVPCAFGKCLMDEEAKKEGKEYMPCNHRMDIDDVWQAVEKLMGNDPVQEYYKGKNGCRWYFEDSEWRCELLEGEKPSEQCTYNP